MMTNKRNLSQNSLAKSALSISTNVDEVDIFKLHLNSYDSSKTAKALNFIYSLIVSLMSNEATAKFTKHHKIIGALMGVLSYLLCRKFIKVDLV